MDQSCRPVARILVADDHPLIRESLRMLLETAPDLQVVAEVADGVEALELAQRTKPDVVLADLRMGGLNGMELTRELKEQLPGVVVVGLSIHNDSYLAQCMYRAGAFAYLDKAANISSILATVRAAADQAWGEDVPKHVKPPSGDGREGEDVEGAESPYSCTS